jgi:hypothetical protein
MLLIFIICNHGSKHGIDTKVDWLMTLSCTETWIIIGVVAHCAVTLSDRLAIFRQAQLSAIIISKMRKENWSAFVQVTNSVALYPVGIRQVEVLCRLYIDSNRANRRNVAWHAIRNISLTGRLENVVIYYLWGTAQVIYNIRNSTYTHTHIHTHTHTQTPVFIYR